MAATSSLPLAAAVVLLLLVASAAVVVPAAGGGNHGGARMVIVRGGPAGRSAAAGARASDNEWRYGRGRRLEDEVAPEFSGLFGAGGSRSYSSGAFEKTQPLCQSSSQCAAQGGGSYTRGCTYENHCPHTPT